MYIIDKIKNRINQNFNTKAISNIEKVNAKLYKNSDTSNYGDVDVILFI